VTNAMQPAQSRRGISGDEFIRPISINAAQACKILESLTEETSDPDFSDAVTVLIQHRHFFLSSSACERIFARICEFNALYAQNKDPLTSEGENRAAIISAISKNAAALLLHQTTLSLGEVEQLAAIKIPAVAEEVLEHLANRKDQRARCIAMMHTLPNNWTGFQQIALQQKIDILLRRPDPKSLEEFMARVKESPPQEMIQIRTFAATVREFLSWSNHPINFLAFTIPVARLLGNTVSILGCPVAEFFDIKSPQEAVTTALIALGAILWRAAEIDYRDRRQCR
jgi:hypothetical protein